MLEQMLLQVKEKQGFLVPGKPRLPLPYEIELSTEELDSALHNEDLVEITAALIGRIFDTAAQCVHMGLPLDELLRDYHATVLTKRGPPHTATILQKHLEKPIEDIEV